MYQFAVDVPRINRSTILGLTLGGVWCAGVSLGLWAACFYGEPVAALCLAAGGAELSFGGSCIVTMLPLLFSAFAVFFFHRAGAILACAVRGITIGCLLGCVVRMGGLWLGMLLLFSGLVGSSVLLWLLWRRISGGTDRFRKDLICALAVAAVISLVDTWGVAPFLVRALSF